MLLTDIDFDVMRLFNVAAVEHLKHDTANELPPNSLERFGVVGIELDCRRIVAGVDTTVFWTKSGKVSRHCRRREQLTEDFRSLALASSSVVFVPGPFRVKTPQDAIGDALGSHVQRVKAKPKDLQDPLFIHAETGVTLSARREMPLLELCWCAVGIPRPRNQVIVGDISHKS